MSEPMEDSAKIWTAKQKTTLVLDIMQDKTAVSEASRAHDLTSSGIESWVNDARKVMENALPLDTRQQHGKELQGLRSTRGQDHAKYIRHKNAVLA